MVIDRWEKKHYSSNSSVKNAWGFGGYLCFQVSRPFPILQSKYSQNILINWRRTHMVPMIKLTRIVTIGMIFNILLAHFWFEYE